MTRRCDSNPAQYERNRRFGHLVYVLGRSAGGAKLPSVGLCLNASKAESRLVRATISSDPSLCSGKDSLRTPSRSREPCRAAQSASRLSRSLTWQGGGPKSSVDDLCTGRGVVLGRAATFVRSTETLPFGPEDLSRQLGKPSDRRGPNTESDWEDECRSLVISRPRSFFVVFSKFPEPATFLGTSLFCHKFP